jgi:hypothetical protein
MMKKRYVIQTISCASFAPSETYAGSRLYKQSPRKKIIHPSFSLLRVMAGSFFGQIYVWALLLLAQ